MSPPDCKDASTQTAPFKLKHSVTRINQTVKQKYKRFKVLPEIQYLAMRSQNRRLQTFKCVMPKDRALEFAKYGFFSVYSGDALQCAFCKLFVFDWEYWGNDVRAEHLLATQRSCPLAQGRDESRNIAPKFKNIESVPADFVAYEPYDISDYIFPKDGGEN